MVAKGKELVKRYFTLENIVYGIINVFWLLCVVLLCWGAIGIVNYLIF